MTLGMQHHANEPRVDSVLSRLRCLSLSPELQLSPLLRVSGMMMTLTRLPLLSLMLTSLVSGYGAPGDEKCEDCITVVTGLQEASMSNQR